MNCDSQVIFPLLFDLLAETPSTIEPALLDESRIRTATIMSKVFLHHLTPLITLTSFNELWLEILDYLEKFIKVGSDMLFEAMLEGLKNMLLVMNSVRSYLKSQIYLIICASLCMFRYEFFIAAMVSLIRHCGT